MKTPITEILLAGLGSHAFVALLKMVTALGLYSYPMAPACL